MSAVYFIADLHFGHVNICKFRPFKSIDSPDYYSVCCEQVDYTPLNLQTIRTDIKGLYGN